VELVGQALIGVAVAEQLVQVGGVGDLAWLTIMALAWTRRADLELRGSS
jgi:hypothetical protein